MHVGTSMCKSLQASCCQASYHGERPLASNLLFLKWQEKNTPMATDITSRKFQKVMLVHSGTCWKLYGFTIQFLTIFNRGVISLLDFLQKWHHAVANIGLHVPAPNAHWLPGNPIPASCLIQPIPFFLRQTLFLFWSERIKLAMGDTSLNRL